MSDLLNQLNKFYYGNLKEVRTINYTLYNGLFFIEVFNIPSFLYSLKQGEFDPVSFYLSVDCSCRIANRVANILFPDSDSSENSNKDISSKEDISSKYASMSMAQGVIGTIREQIQNYKKK